MSAPTRDEARAHLVDYLDAVLEGAAWESDGAGIAQAVEGMGWVHAVARPIASESWRERSERLAVELRQARDQREVSW